MCDLQTIAENQVSMWRRCIDVTRARHHRFHQVFET